LMKMSSQGKTTAKTSLSKITARGGTNLSGGLLRAFDIIDERGVDKNDVAAILLMTDGLANEGIRGSDKIVLATRNRINEIPAPTTLYTFGFGSDHDGTLLSKMAEASGSGTYYFMQSVDSIPQAFADCLGGLLSVFAQNISMTITSGNGDNHSSNSGIKINSITTSFAKTTVEEGKKYSVQIGDIFSEEQRDVLIDVSLPAIQSPTEQYQLLSVQVKYFNVVLAQTHTINGTVSIQRTQDEPTNPQVSTKVDEQKNRVKTAKATEDAQKLGDAGDIEKARTLLESCKTSIAQSISSSTPASTALIADLDASLGQMRTNADYEEHGSKNLSSHSRQHYVQRGAYSNQNEYACYATVAKTSNRTDWFGKLTGK